MSLVIANISVAAALVGVYALLKWVIKWFGDDHLNIPPWMSLTSIPLGIAVPASRLMIDGMLIVAAIFFINEGIYQSTGYSPLGYVFHHLDQFGRKMYQKVFQT